MSSGQAAFQVFSRHVWVVGTILGSIDLAAWLHLKIIHQIILLNQEVFQSIYNKILIAKMTWPLWPFRNDRFIEGSKSGMG